jgi:hypothetical protein
MAIANKILAKPKQITPIWLDRSAVPQLPFYTVVTTYEMYVAELKKIDAPISDASSFYSSDACVNFFNNAKNEEVCFVCIDSQKSKDVDRVGVIGLLVHESMHILQSYYESHGEKCPAKENQAYLIQHISQQVITEYSRQVNEAKPNLKTKSA